MLQHVVSNRYVKKRATLHCLAEKRGLVSVVIEVVIKKCSHNARNKIANTRDIVHRLYQGVRWF